MFLMTPKKLRVLVLCGGQSSEHEVSLNTAAKVLENLDVNKYEPSLATIQKDGRWRFGSDKKAVSFGEAIEGIKKGGFDFVFIAMHGAYGEDGRVQSLCELTGLPYSGSGVLASAVAMDKHLTNILYAANDFLTPRYFVAEINDKNKFPKFTLPAVVKPVNGGSSVGVSIMKNKKDLGGALKKAFKEDARIMIQEYLNGREFTCGVIENRGGKPLALSPAEIIPKNSKFFDYEAKYQQGGSLEITPPNLPKEKIKELKGLATKAHQILGCGGMSRSDFILKRNKFYILETNTIPGMTETSLFPQGARAAGIDFSTLLDLIIAAGLRR